MVCPNNRFCTPKVRLGGVAVHITVARASIGLKRVRGQYPICLFGRRVSTWMIEREPLTLILPRKTSLKLPIGNRPHVCWKPKNFLSRN